MLFGFDTFARVPFAAIDDHNNVTVNSGANALTITVGPLAIASSSVIQQAAGDPLTLKIGSITITTQANLTATAMPLTLDNRLSFRIADESGYGTTPKMRDSKKFRL